MSKIVHQLVDVDEVEPNEAIGHAKEMDRHMLICMHIHVLEQRYLPSNDAYNVQ